jgi:hypothetical protein
MFIVSSPIDNVIQGTNPCSRPRPLHTLHPYTYSNQGAKTRAPLKSRFSAKLTNLKKIVQSPFMVAKRHLRRKT